MPEPEQGIEPGDDAMSLNDLRARTRAGAALGQLSHPDLARRHQRSSLLALCAGMSYCSFGYARGPIDSLSTRERQVLQLVVEGHTSNEIARMIHLSPKSVETYRSRLMLKLDVRDVPSLVKFALEHGLTRSK